MRKSIVFLFLAVSVTAFAQPRMKGRTAADTTHGLIASDSIAVQLQRQKDSIAAAQQEAATKAEWERNGQAILELQRENTSRKKKSAYLNLAIGAGFFLLLVFGLLRRRKKPANT